MTETLLLEHHPLGTSCSGRCGLFSGVSNMDFSALLATLSAIKGATFASVDCTTYLGQGVQKRTTGMNVILFNSERSGYEAMVKKRLADAGRNPDNFAVSPLPWGRRLYGPIIQKDSKIGDTVPDQRYLQMIVLSPGESEYHLRSVRGFDIPCRPEDLPGPMKRRLNQHLPLDKQVEVRTINLEHIDRLRVLGETFSKAA